VSDYGGFQRAADALHLSQGAVSQHVRRLEVAVGRPLVERRGRGSSFTREGEQLLKQARRILDAHDEALGLFDLAPEQSLVIGTTEHAADRLLPQLRQALLERMPEYMVRFRVDRGGPLRQDLAQGRIDLALLLGPTEEPAAGATEELAAAAVGHLELTWYAAPDWSARAGDPVPLVTFDDPCAIRSRALETLESHGLDADITCEAPHLAGVQAAVRAGLGVALMATNDRRPEGLLAVESMPSAAPIELTLWQRQGLRADLSDEVASLLRLLPTSVDVYT
jgi:DNA-binding transcriptional LysR family regulator